MKFLTIEDNSMGFFAFVVWELAKVNGSECQQDMLVAYNCRIITSRLKARRQPLV